MATQDALLTDLEARLLAEQQTNPHLFSKEAIAIYLYHMRVLIERDNALADYCLADLLIRIRQSDHFFKIPTFKMHAQRLWYDVKQGVAFWGAIAFGCFSLFSMMMFLTFNLEIFVLILAEVGAALCVFAAIVMAFKARHLNQQEHMLIQLLRVHEHLCNENKLNSEKTATCSQRNILKHTSRKIQYLTNFLTIMIFMGFIAGGVFILFNTFASLVSGSVSAYCAVAYLIGAALLSRVMGHLVHRGAQGLQIDCASQERPDSPMIPLTRTALDNYQYASLNTTSVHSCAQFSGAAPSTSVSSTRSKIRNHN